jgi:hypothetical protein
MTRPYFARRWLIEDARDAVLQALDAFAKASGLMLPAGQEGAVDGDLPVLFQAIDAHVDRLIERSGTAMPAEPYDPAFVELTARQLAAAQRV